MSDIRFRAPPKDLEHDERTIGSIKPSIIIALPAAAYGMTSVFGVALFHFLYPNFFPEVASVINSLIVTAGGNPVDVWLMRLVASAVFLFFAFLPAMVVIVRLLATRYDLTRELIYYHRGFPSRQHDQIEVVRIRDIGVDRPFWMLLFNVGNVVIHTVDRTHPTLIFTAVHNPLEWKRFLHELNVKERERMNYREFESTFDGQ